MDPMPVDNNPAPIASFTTEPVAEDGLVRHAFKSPPETLTSPPEALTRPSGAFTSPPGTFTSPPGTFTSPPGTFTNPPSTLTNPHGAFTSPPETFASPPETFASPPGTFASPPPPPPETETPAQDVDESNNTTITASNAQALTEALRASYTQPAPSHELRPQTSYSDTGFTHSYSSHHSNQHQSDYSPQQRFVPTPDPGTPPGYYNGNVSGNSTSNGYGYSHGQVPAPQPPQPQHHYQHQQSQSLSATASRSSSRPSSRLADSSHERYPPSEAGSRTYQDQNQRNPQPLQESAAKNTSVVIKVGMVGDAQIGKTSLMVKYVEGSWDEDYIQTLGVNFMEKTISIRNTEITFSIWDLGGQREFVNMLPLVCNDAVAILFMFDLTRKSTLNSIKEWYRQGRGFNKTAIPFLVGTKYDHFVNFPREEQEEISNQAKRFAKAMKASLIFSSTSHSINVQKIFKIVLSKAFDLRCTIPEIENAGEPLLLYQSV